MGIAAFSYVNLADQGILSASSQQRLTPIQNLQQEHVVTKWRGAGGASDSFVLRWTAAQAVQVVALLGLNLTETGSYRLRLSSSDASGAAGDVFDSGAVAGVSPRYGSIVVLLPEAVWAQYLRFDLADPSLSAIEAGRLFAGAIAKPSINFAYGWERQRVDPSKKIKSEGGQTIISVRPAYRTVRVSFDYLNEADIAGFVEDIEHINGEHVDVLLITDTDSDRLDRDSIFGLVTSSPVSQPSFGILSKAFPIEERL